MRPDLVGHAEQRDGGGADGADSGLWRDGCLVEVLRSAYRERQEATQNMEVLTNLYKKQARKPMSLGSIVIECGLCSGVDRVASQGHWDPPTSPLKDLG